MAYSQHGRDFEHRERRDFDRIYGAHNPYSTQGSVPSLRAIGIMFATIAAIVLLITLLSWSSADPDASAGAQHPAVTETQPAPAVPEQ